MIVNVCTCKFEYSNNRNVERLTQFYKKKKNIALVVWLQIFIYTRSEAIKYLSLHNF